jgi:hypothetical protein
MPLKTSSMKCIENPLFLQTPHPQNLHFPKQFTLISNIPNLLTKAIMPQNRKD